MCLTENTPRVNRLSILPLSSRLIKERLGKKRGKRYIFRAMENTENKLTGLSDEEVRASREKYGTNRIAERKQTTFWSAFMETFGDPMIRILIFITILMMAMWALGKVKPELDIEQKLAEPLGTLMAVILVGIISAKTEVSSDKKYRALKERSKKAECKVLRNGLPHVIAPDEVVKGDFIILQAGDKVAADGVLVSGSLSVDNSVLNGETEECEKSAAFDSYLSEEITGDVFVDSYSLFRGAVISDGSGIMRAERVGGSTMMGKMASEMNDEDVDSPLKVKLTALAKKITVSGYVSAALIVVLYLGKNIIDAGGMERFFALSFSQIFNTFIRVVDLAVLILVCAVPEGLPLMISLVLMQNTAKMLDHNVLVRKAKGIETAGSLNILFTDKTGTITKGFMEVVSLFRGDGEPFSFSEMLGMCILSNTKAMRDKDGNVVGGNATDRALMNYIKAHNGEKALEKAKVKMSEPFSSAKKFAQSLVQKDKESYVFYTGAYEKILAECAFYINEKGEVLPFTAEKREALERKILSLAEKSMRMIAFSYKEGEDFVEGEIASSSVLISLAAIKDEVRAESREAIRAVKRAGIQVVMITGDKTETAKAIARDACLIGEDENENAVFSSSDLASMSDEEIEAVIPSIRVISRALPTDKSRMVRVCQKLNLVCAMTGDGVNDSPALKKADVGFAMGSGTEAAKEAGDIVILDDNFASIKSAIWYGRTIYHNILKFITFQLGINFVAVLTTLLSPLAGLSSPLTVVMLLFVNLVCDSLGSLMFGNEAEEEKYLLEKPRRRDESIVSAKMLYSVISSGLYLTAVGLWLLRSAPFIGISGTYETSSLFFVFFIWASLFNGFNCRSDGLDIFSSLKRNPAFIRVFFVIVLIQFLVVYSSAVSILGIVGEIFGVAPLSAFQYLCAVLLSATVIPVSLSFKLFSSFKSNKKKGEV